MAAGNTSAYEELKKLVNDIVSTGTVSKSSGTTSTNGSGSGAASGTSQKQGTADYFSSRRKALGLDRIRVDLDYINSFISDSQKHLNSVLSDNKKMGFGTSRSIYESRKKASDDLHKRSYEINRYLEANKDELDEGAYKSLKDYLDSFDKASSQSIYSFYRNDKLYSLFDTEEDYAKWSAYQTPEGRKERYASNQKRIEELKEERKRVSGGDNPLIRLALHSAGAIGTDDYLLGSQKIKGIDQQIAELENEMRMYERGNTDESGFYYGSKAVDDYGELANREDFDKISSNRNFRNPERDALSKYDAMADSSTWYTDANNNIFDAFGNKIDPSITDEKGNILHPYANNSEYAVTDRLGLYLNASEVAKQEAIGTPAGTEGTWESIIKDGYDGNWELLEENEVDIYYYLLNNSGQEAADKYLADMKTELNRRNMTQTNIRYTTAFSEADALERLAMSIASTPAQLFGGATSFIEDTAMNLMGKDINPYSAAHAGTNFSSTVRSNQAQAFDEATGEAKIPFINFTAGDLYQAGMSALDMAVGGKLGSGAYEVLMGMGSASNEAKRLYEQGASREQIMWGGALAGAAEIVFEHASIESLINLKDADTALQFVKNLLIQGGIEASEEGFTEIANTITNSIVMGSESDWAKLVEKNNGDKLAAFIEKVQEVGNSAFAGFVSGSMGGSAHSAASYAQAQVNNAELGQYISGANNTDALKALAQEMAKTASKGDQKNLTKQSERLGKKFLTEGGKNQAIGRLYNTVRSAVTEQNISEISAALQEKGISKKDANAIAGAVAVQANGMELTKDQQKVLDKFSKNADVQNIVNDILKNKESGINQRARSVAKFEFNTMRNDIISRMEQAVPGQDNSSASDTVDSKKESLSETDYEVSTEGKTIINSTGETVSINSIADIKDGKVTLNLEDGSSVEASDLSFSSKSEAILYDTVAQMGASVKAANILVNGFKAVQADSLKADEYAYGVAEAFRYGKLGIPSTALSRSTFASKLTVAQQDYVYRQGKKIAGKQVAQQQAAVNNAFNEAKAVAEKPGSYQAVLEDGITVLSLNESQRASYQLADQIAQAAKVNIHVYVGKTGERGYYKPSTDEIWLNLNATNKSRKSMMAFTLGHELVHRAKKGSPGKYQAFTEFLMKEYGKTGASVETMIAQELKAAKDHGIKMTEEQAFEEVVCDACQRMLLDTDAGKRLAEFGAQSRENKSFLEDLKRWISEFLDKLRSIFQDVDPDSLAANEFAKFDATAKQILADMYVDMTIDAGDKLSTIQSAFGKGSNLGANDKKLDAAGKARLKELQEEGASFSMPKGDHNGDSVDGENAVDKTTFSDENGVIQDSTRGDMDDNRRVQRGTAETEGENEPHGRRDSGNSRMAQKNKEWGNLSNETRRRITKVVNSHIANSPNYDELFLLMCRTVNRTPDNVSAYMLKKAISIMAEDLYSDATSLHPVLFEDKWSYLGGSVTGLYRAVLEIADENLYKLPVGEDTSPRALLSNALEAITTNPIEKQKLQEYKGQVAMLNAEEKKLNDLRKQIKRLSFANGNYDAAKLRELQFEANMTANRINTYDRQLLRMEASKPLQNVLTREKKMAYDRGVQKGKEALDAYRERTEKKQQEIIERYQESRKRGVENRQKTFMRQKIRKVIRDLDKLLNRGNKKTNVKEDMKDFVANALASAEILFVDSYTNEDMVRNGVATDLTPEEAKFMNEARAIMDEIASLPTGYEGWMERQEKENKLKGRLAYRMAKLRDVFVRERARINQTQVSEVLGNLADSYAKLQNSEYAHVQGAYHEAVHEYLKMLQEDVGGTIIRDMTIGQLEELHKAYTMVKTTVYNANRMFAENLNNTREALANRVMFEVHEAGGEHGLWSKIGDKVNSFSWNNEKPVYAFERIGSQTLKTLYGNIRKGQDVWAVNLQEANDFRKALYEKYKHSTWDVLKRYKFTSSSGIDFELNLDQIMSLYAYSKRAQAHDHLLKGGFVFDGNTEVLVNKHGLKVPYLNKDATAYNVSFEILEEIISKLTPEQKAFADDMQEYLSSTMGEKGNEVSMELYGVKLFNEKFYFPLRSAGQYMERAKEADMKKEQGQINIANSGFSKATKIKASNPVVLAGFMDVWASHVNEMSMYHSFVLPMEDFRRVYNYSSPHMEGQQSASVNGVIQNAYGAAATDYIDKLYRDLNGGAITDNTTGIINKLMGLFKKGAVFASASVTLQQPSAIARATALVDIKHFIGPKVDAKRHKALWTEVKKYAPVAIIKEMGFFDTNMGRSAVDFLTAEEYNGIKEKAEALIKDESYRDELLSKAPALADELSWCVIWEAIKRETKARHPDMDVKSDEFLKLAGERFSEVIDRTQVYDSVLARSANMRSKDTGMKMATAFMAEPTTSINMVADALRKGKKGDKKFARRAIGSVVASVILNSILVSFVYAARDDDEDQSFAEKYVEAVVGGIVDGLNPATYIPFVKDVVSIIQGYDVERSDMAVISDLWSAWQKLGRDDVSAWSKVEGFVGSICQLFGLPVKNIMRDARSIYQVYDTIVNGENTSAMGLFYAISSGVFGGDDMSNAEKLYIAKKNEQAILGTDSYTNRVASRYKDENAANAAIVSVIKDMYLNGEIDAYGASRELILYAEKNSDEASELVYKWDYIKENNTDEGYSKYLKFYEAVQTGKNLKSVIQDYADRGVEVSTLSQQLTEHFKPEYIEMSASERASLKGHLLNAMELCGKSRDEAMEVLNDWDFEVKNGFAYSNRKSAYLNGDITPAQLRKVLIETGGYTEEKADAQIEAYNWEKQGYENVTAAAIQAYNQFCAADNVPKDIYLHIKQFSNNTKNDVNEETGKTINYSAMKKVMAEIDAQTGLTPEQKTAIARSLGWAEKNIKKYKLW